MKNTCKSALVLNKEGRFNFFKTDRSSHDLRDRGSKSKCKVEF